MSVITELALRHFGEEYRDAASRAEDARLTLAANLRYAVREGMSPSIAAQLAGVSRTTVYKAVAGGK